MIITPENLRTISNYAKMQNVTYSYIFKLIKKGKLSFVDVCGKKFIDISVFPKLPS